MQEIKTIALEVQRILETRPETRDNDYLLYYSFLERYSAERGLGLLHYPLGTFLANFDRLDVPPLETIGRMRRKVQETFPELKGNRAEKRKEAEDDFRQFARENLKNN